MKSRKNKHKLFFSVIIPTLDEACHLPQLLKALVNQTHTAFEVLVVDGKSNDGTLDQCKIFAKAFKKEGIEFCCFEVDKRNVSYQRNYGAKRANGKYFVFFDADVRIGQTFLSRLEIEITENNALLLTTWIKPDSSDVADEALVFLMNISTEAIRHTPTAFVPGFNTIIEKKTFFDLGMFNEKAKHGEDHLFSKEAKKKGIKIFMFRKPVLTVSLRRFRSEGRIETIKRLMMSFVHTTFIGPITKDLFKYEMGGKKYSKQPVIKIQTNTRENSPFFSIITPTLNEEKCLPRLLDTLLVQSFTDYEVIVCDGQSEDKTVAVGKSYEKKFKQNGSSLKIIHSYQRNISSQRNKGVDCASGAYCVFVDADVQMHADFLSRLHTALASEEIDVAGVWAKSDTPLIADRMVALILSLAQEIPTKLQKPYIIGHCIIAKRSVMKKIKFDPEALPVEDYDFVTRVSKQNFKIAIFREPKITVSLRRYQKYGRINTLLNYARITSVIIFEGQEKISEHDIHYPTGGQVHS